MNPKAWKPMTDWIQRTKIRNKIYGTGHPDDPGAFSGKEI